MNETAEEILAVIFCIAVFAWGIWRSRKIPGYWGAEAIQQRMRDGVRLIAFMGCLILVLMSFLRAFYQDHDYVGFVLWAIPAAIVGWLCRPRWHRKVKASAPNPDAPTESH